MFLSGLRLGEAIRDLSQPADENGMSPRSAQASPVKYAGHYGIAGGLASPLPAKSVHSAMAGLQRGLNTAINWA